MTTLDDLLDESAFDESETLPDWDEGAEFIPGLGALVPQLGFLDPIGAGIKAVGNALRPPARPPAPTVNVAKRAITNASPRFFAVTSPSFEMLAALSLPERKTARSVTSRSVPSEYLARAVTCCDPPGDSSSICLGSISSATGCLTPGGSSGAPALIQRRSV